LGNSREISGVAWWYRISNEANLDVCEKCAVARRKPEVVVVRDVRRDGVVTRGVTGKDRSRESGGDFAWGRLPVQGVAREPVLAAERDPVRRESTRESLPRVMTKSVGIGCGFSAERFWEKIA
jgi:hypothetical protein